MRGPSFEIRQATQNDLKHVAELRWRLKNEDDANHGVSCEDFISQFTALPVSAGLTHWLAFDAAAAVSVMSVQRVPKVPSPGRLDESWGYLTNCYVLPSHRNGGLGGRMLAQIAEWALAQRLELLVVWPSARAYPFYERAGFARYQDPLVLMLSEE